jgi:DNA repair exonuclease SbcCD ATPase subunit
MKTPQQLLAKLRDLSKSAGENYYERISIADTLLQDKHWLEAEHAGSDFKAAKALEDHYFHDLSGAMGLFDLLHIFRKHPEQKDWEKHGYNLKKMYATLKKTADKAEPPRRATVAELDAAQEQVKDLQYQLQHQRKLVKEHKTQGETLSQQVDRLKEENFRLKGRVEELERILEKWTGKKVA